MKYFVASDIHGSFYYAKLMVDAFIREGCDKMILLGDILYHGPRNDLPYEYKPKEVITLLNHYRDVITCVRGNCDAEVDQMVLDFKIMDDFKFLEIGDRRIFLTHGHVYNQSNVPFIAKKCIMLHGHTHVPVVKDYGDYIYMNPGSVSIPKNNSCHSYMVIENGVYSWKNLETGDEYMKYVDIN